jgi:hypothetical protein
VHKRVTHGMHRNGIFPNLAKYKTTEIGLLISLRQVFGAWVPLDSDGAAFCSWSLPTGCDVAQAPADGAQPGAVAGDGRVDEAGFVPTEEFGGLGEG